MIKKLLTFIKFIMVGLIWSCVYFAVSNKIFIFFWNFNLFAATSWQLIANYWNEGGVINNWKDYLLIFLLLVNLPLWIYGWKKLLRVNLLKIILYPIEAYNDHELKRYAGKISRLSIKNMGVKGMDINEEIEMKSHSKESVSTDEEVNKIRQAVKDKINSVIK